MGFSFNRRHAALAAIVLVGLILRTVNAAHESLWADEALTLLIVQRSPVELLLLPTDPTPGLYYLLHKFLIVPGAGLAAIRGVSIVAGTLAILAGYALGKVAANKGLALAALVAVWPSLVDYSQEARAYSLLVLLVLCSAAGLLWWAREARTGRATLPLAVFLGGAVLSFYTHFDSVFWIAPAVTVAAFIGWREATPQARNRLVVGLAVAAILAVPEVHRLLIYPRQQMEWLSLVGPLGFLGTVGDVLLPSALWGHNATISAAGAVLALAALSGLAWRRGALDRIELRAVVWILLAVPLATWIFSFFIEPIFMVRTILIVVPGVALLLVLTLRRVELGVVVALLAAALLVGGTVRHKEDWNLAARTLTANVRPGDAVVVCGWKAAGLRHAIKSELPAPLLLYWANGLRRIEDRAGGDRQWEQHYFAALETGKMPDGQPAFDRARRVWIVTSDCPMPWHGRNVAIGNGVGVDLLTR